MNELDWSGFVTLKLYSPDFKMDGKKTGYDILQGEWHLYQDGRVRAVEESQTTGSGKTRLPPASAYRIRFGLTVGEAADTFGSTQPQPVSRSRSELGRGQGQARAQYYNHRRVFSDPNMGHPGGIDLAPFDPRYGGEDQRASHFFTAPAPPPRRASGGPLYPPPPGIAPPPGATQFGFPPPGPRYDQEELGYNFQSSSMQMPASGPPPPENYYAEKPPVQRRPTVLTRRRSGSRSRRESASSGSRETKTNTSRRKLSRRRSGRMSAPPGGSFGPPPGPMMPPNDPGCGCIIC